jgi:hypothetical protein
LLPAPSNATPAQVRRILGKPQPVRVWCNVWDQCAEGVDTGTIIGARLHGSLRLHESAQRTHE